MSDQTDLVFNVSDWTTTYAAQEDKTQALHFYPCKSRKDSRELKKEQGKGKTLSVTNQHWALVLEKCDFSACLNGLNSERKLYAPFAIK